MEVRNDCHGNHKGANYHSCRNQEKFNISAKDRVDFIADGDRIILVPVKTLQDFRGAVKGVAGAPEME